MVAPLRIGECLLKQLERVMNARMRAEEVRRFVDAHHQNIADRFAFVFDRECVLIEATSLTHIADDAHVR
jgi:hypothetical protein